jgi:hypothetical protein
MIDPLVLRFEVALADIRGQMDFHGSLAYWHRQAPAPTDDWQRALLRPTTPLRVEGTRVLEVADCPIDVTVPDGSVLHVYGDLSGKVTASGQCEVVVAGDVLAQGCVDGDGIVRVYIAGNLLGSVRNRGSARVWVRGHHRGEVVTGCPSTHLHVLGDCTGSVRTESGPALLYLEVGGFMPFELLERTAAVGYTEFCAVIRRSNRPPGIYPDRAAWKALSQHRSYNRWTVAEQSAVSD